MSELELSVIFFTDLQELLYIRGFHPVLVILIAFSPLFCFCFNFLNFAYAKDSPSRNCFFSRSQTCQSCFLWFQSLVAYLGLLCSYIIKLKAICISSSNCMVLLSLSFYLEFILSLFGWLPSYFNIFFKVSQFSFLIWNANWVPYTKSLFVFESICGLSRLFYWTLWLFICQYHTVLLIIFW